MPITRYSKSDFNEMEKGLFKKFRKSLKIYELSEIDKLISETEQLINQAKPDNKDKLQTIIKTLEGYKSIIQKGFMKITSYSNIHDYFRDRGCRYSFDQFDSYKGYIPDNIREQHEDMKSSGLFDNFIILSVYYRALFNTFDFNTLMLFGEKYGCEGNTQLPIQDKIFFIDEWKKQDPETLKILKVVDKINSL